MNQICFKEALYLDVMYHFTKEREDTNNLTTVIKFGRC